jgi:heme exporter protein A
MQNAPFASNKLEIKGLCAEKSSKSLFDDVSAEVASGQLLRISSEDFASKSTFLQILCGLQTAHKGKVCWNESNIKFSTDYSLQIFYMGIQDGLKSTLTVIENIRFFQRLYSSKACEAEELLALIELSSHANTVVADLSVGQRRRLAIIRLLLSNRGLWILDEPFLGIEKEDKTLIEELFSNHLSAGGIIVVCQLASFKYEALNYLEQVVEV